MFADIRSDTLDRIQSLREFLQATCRLRSRRIVAEVKGLAFVQMYAVYEETVRAVVRTALTHIKALSLPIETIRMELLGLVLHDELKAVTDTAGTKNEWDRKVKLFLQVVSANPVSVPDTVFPSDGSQFRFPQLNTIWALFGIPGSPIPHPKYRLQIAELVDNRNAISHGRRPASEVGRGFTLSEIRKRLSGIKRICLHIIGEMEGHCADKANLCR